MTSVQGEIPGLDTDTGNLAREYLICQHIEQISSQGIWMNENPFDHPLPTFLAQLILLTVFTKLIYFLVKPLRQSVTSAQIIAGIVISPALLWRIVPYMTNLYPPGGKLILQTAAEMGFMLHLFLMGLQTDLSILKKAGRDAMLIGTMSFLFPIILGMIVILILHGTVDLEKLNIDYLGYIAALNSMTAFPVITSILGELKILNSEIGQLAIHTAMTCDILDWTIAITMTTFGIPEITVLACIGNIASVVAFLVIIFFVIRPLIVWMIKRRPEETLGETTFFLILLLVLVCGFWSELLGLHGAFGPYMLGIALPDGPPVGTTVVSRLHTFTNEMLAPIVFAITGLRTDFFSIKGSTGPILELVIMTGNIGKFVGTIMPAIFCGVPFWDALSLTLIMCCKGIIDISIYNHLLDRTVIDSQAFSLMVINVLLATGIATPLVSHLYDPSRRYMTYTRRTIQHTKKDSQLRILVCFYNHDDIPTILDILEASNPTRYNPIAVFAMYLKELSGRATAILVPHHNLNKCAIGGSDQIANAFKNFEQHHLGSVIVQHFTAIAPFDSMHNDVCTMALDKRTTIIILPFHKCRAVDGTIETSNPLIRVVNQNVIEKAPCSVGIFVDRKQQKTGLSHSFTTGNSPPYRLGMMFLGGPDDPEALAYSIRMAEHPNVCLMVIQVKHSGSNNERFRDFISDSRVNSMSKESIIYREEEVRDGVGTTNVIRSIENDLDLLIVGRQQERGSPLISGLEEWNENPEMGVLGDVLATWEFQFSVLVIQQQPLKSNSQFSNFKNSKRHKRKDSTVYDHAFDDEFDAPV